MLGLRWNWSASPPSSRFGLCFIIKCSSSFAPFPAPLLRAFRASCWSQCSNPDGVTSPNLVELEYANLNLKDFYGAGCAPVKVPEWEQVFTNPSLPLMVDIGCGSGRFLIWLAKHFPESRNYLGLEIRNKLVQRSQFWVKELGLQNIYFMFANATISFEQLVSAYPGPLTLVSILCPDPHFKKRHHKRRVVQKSLVDSVAKNLSLGGQVILQSDVLDAALDMRDQFDARADVLKHIDALDAKFTCDAQGWLLENPMGIRTEREIHAELEGAKIYRRMYQKA